jgi:hypothetical protein
MKGPSRFVRHHRYPKCEIHGRKWHWVIKYWREINEGRVSITKAKRESSTSSFGHFCGCHKIIDI